MKKWISLLLCLAMVLAWLPAGSPFAAAADSSPFDGGSGTAEDPYLVSTVEQLQEVRNYSSSNFLQTNDIDLSGVSYMPSQSIAEGGVYDGGGNRITGYKGSSALFSSNSGTIQNLGLRDSEITYISSPYGQHLTYTIGGMVGTNSGTIHNCYVDNMDMSVSISMQATHSFSTLTLNVGGMVGINSGTISCCYITGSVSGSGTCKKYNIAGAEAGASVYVGGISGRNVARINEPGTMNNCYSMAEVTGGTNGTLSGFNGATITKCYYNGPRATGSGAGSADATYKSLNEMRSAAFANELNGNSSPHNWEMGRTSGGDVAVVQTMQNLTVSTDHPSGTYHMPITVGFTSDGSPYFDLLYYSIDGVTEGWQTYNGPITLDQDAVVRVRAVHSYNPNAYRVSTFRYKAAKYPVEASPAPGTYTTVPQTITLTTQTPDAKIYYTTDGTVPTDKSTGYSGPFSIFKNTTVTAAAKVGDEWGDPLSFTYKISPEITPDKPAGDYTAPFTVKLTSSVPQYDIYYTVDGFSDPTVNGTKYDPDQGIEIYKTTTLRVASTFEGEWSDITTFQYDFPEPVITPSVEPGEHDDVVHLTLTCDTPYVTLSYYASDLGMPETAYEPGDTIDIYKSTKLTVYARYNGQFVTREDWTYTLPEPELIAEPEAGAYNRIQTITLSSNIPSYQLWYTLDGSDPATDGVPYSGPFELDHSATLKVCAKYGEHVVKTDSFSYNLSAVPSVTADPAAGDITAPEDIELSAPNTFYNIYYTTDGSNPKTSSTRLKYEEPIHVEYPVPITILAVPELNGTYGTVSEFCYTFSSQSLTVTWESVEKRVDYEIALTASNTLPEDKTVDFYAAAYQDGRMLGVTVERVELPQGTKNKNVAIAYPYAGLLPENAVLKLFCLDSVTGQPYCEAAEYPVSQIPVIYELDSLTAQPTAIEGTVGDVIPVELTAHYLNGKADQIVSPYSYSSGSTYVARPSSGFVTLVSAGSTTVTYTYISDGITKSVQIPVTVKEPTYNLGFLADPTADPLPADAIPISNAQELAALSDSSDGAKTAGKTFYLTCDIQLTGEWKPVYGFQGTLDGRGHKISGLYISAASKQMLAGLFASAYDAVIKNLAVEIDPRGVSAYNETSKVDVTYAAGLVGQSKNTDFINCYTTGGPISATGVGPCAGGLVGSLANGSGKRVINCFSTCNVSAKAIQATYTNYCLAGGLIGELSSWSIYETTSLSRCYATGDVSVNYPGGSTGGGGTQAGGLVAQGERVELSDCFALGDVSARKSNVLTASSVFAGGLGGWLIDAKLTRCYAAGDVYGGSKSYVGGLLASSADSISNCYRVGQSVTGTEQYNGGTLVTVPNAQSSYSGFDFNSTWQFTQGAFQGLPHLKHQN